MPKFEISITYSKVVEAANKADAESIITRIESDSPLDDEYGPFSTLDVFTEVTEIKEEL